MEVPKRSWYELCELAAKEQDPEKLLRLVREINRLLEKKESDSKSVSRLKTGDAA